MGRGKSNRSLSSTLRKPRSAGGVEVDAVRKGARQLGRHDSDIFLVSENIAKGEPDEFDIIFCNKLYDFADGGIHKAALLSENHNIPLRSFSFHMCKADGSPLPDWAKVHNISAP